MTTEAVPIPTEADLCARFIAALPADWTPYPETAGFDLVLVHKADGFQIGVEAKLRLNPKVLVQILGDHEWWGLRKEGPDCRAVLVPDGATVAGVGELAHHLAVTVIRWRGKHRNTYNGAFDPPLPTLDKRWGRSREADWHELCPEMRVRLPAYVPDTAAGASAPVQLTDWKIKAIKIAIIVEKRGHVTRADFRALGIDPRRWIDQGWLIAGPAGLVANCPPNFKGMHPRNYGEIAADFEKWMPRVEAAALLP